MKSKEKAIDLLKRVKEDIEYINEEIIKEWEPIDENKEPSFFMKKKIDEFEKRIRNIKWNLDEYKKIIIIFNKDKELNELLDFVNKYNELVKEAVNTLKQMEEISRNIYSNQKFKTRAVNDYYRNSRT